MIRSRVNLDKIVVLGSGWAGFKILQSFKHPSHELICISVNNHFLFTPLLTTTTVGTLEFRGITEPTMSVKRLNKFIHASAVSVDAAKKTVRCRSVYDVAKSEGGERYFPEFDVSFDKLVIGEKEKKKKKVVEFFFFFFESDWCSCCNVWHSRRARVHFSAASAGR